METIEQHLTEHGVAPTAVRILVWRAVSQIRTAFSLADIEESLPLTDRSSIFRALRLFAQHSLLHEIDDGSGHQKYCVCRCEGHTHLNHIHFTCRICGKAYCLEEHTIPLVDLPEGFEVEDAEYVIKGICPHCRKR